MTTVTHIRKVTPKHFADWLGKRTAGLHKEFSYDVSGVNVQIVLNQARERGALDNPNEVFIEGDYSYIRQRAGKLATGGFRETYIRFQLTPLDDIRTEITTVCSDIPAVENYCAELLAEIEKRWPAEGDSGGEPTFRVLQQFLFDADAKDVLIYFMGGETERRWVDPPYTLMVGKPMAFKGLLHPSSSSQALYALQLHVYICNGEAVDLDRYNESGYWIARQAFAAVIYLSQDRPGTCTAQLYFQTNPLYWYGEWNTHCAPPLAESLGELFVGALWQSWIDGWLAMKTVTTTVRTSHRQKEFTFNANAKEVRDFFIGDTEDHPRRIEWTSGEYFIQAFLILAAHLPAPVKNRVYGGRMWVNMCRGDGTNLGQLKEEDWLINGRTVFFIGISQSEERKCQVSLFDEEGWSTGLNVYELEVCLGFINRWWAETIRNWQMQTEQSPPAPVKPVELSTRQKILIGLLLVFAIAAVLFVPTLLAVLGVLPYLIALVLWVIALAIGGAVALLGQGNNILSFVEKLFSKK